MWALRAWGVGGRWLLLAAIVLAFAGGTAGAAPEAASARIGRCGTASLTVTRVRFGTAGSFHEYLELALVHRSSRTCTLRGYPRLRFRGPSGVTLRLAVSHVRSDAVRTITLEGGQRATFTLHYLGSGPCSRQLTATEVLVTPPGDHGSLRIAQQL